MGMFDFFKSRKAKESAVPVSTEIEDQTKALGSFASPEGQPVVGTQVPGTPGFDVQGLNAADGLAMLSQLGPMIQQAMKTGNVQVTQGQPQVIDMRGTGLREEILGIMGQHGISTDGSGTQGGAVNAGDYGDMQKQIADALEKHGIPTGAESTNMAQYGDMQKELMDVLEKHGFHNGMPPGWTGSPAIEPPQAPGADGSSGPAAPSGS
jgi:hypothetical protein